MNLFHVYGNSSIVNTVPVREDSRERDVGRAPSTRAPMFWRMNDIPSR